MMGEIILHVKKRVRIFFITSSFDFFPSDSIISRENGKRVVFRKYTIACLMILA